MIASIGQGGAGGGPAFDPTVLLPIVTGATSLIGALFGYIILPVWVFYLLKDRVALTAQFDRSLPAAWRFDIWAILRIVRRRVRPVGPGAARARRDGRRRSRSSACWS